MPVGVANKTQHGHDVEANVQPVGLASARRPWLPARSSGATVPRPGPARVARVGGARATALGGGTPTHLRRQEVPIQIRVDLTMGGSITRQSRAYHA